MDGNRAKSVTSQHTPGPWTKDQDAFSVYANDEDMKVCDIRGWGHLTGVGGLRLSDEDAVAVQQANARLIAAAPTMLAKLKDLHTAMVCACRLWEPSGGPVPCITCQLWLVIAEAEGIDGKTA